MRIALALLVALASVSTGAAAQSSLSAPPATDAPRSMCFRGAPADRCHRYSIFEVTGTMSSGFWLREFGQCANDPARCRSTGFENGYWAWELGAMQNMNTRFAAGGHVHIGAGSRTTVRFALEPRGRLWLGRSLTLDAAAGPLWARSNGRMVSGMTSEVILGAADLVGISAGIESLGSPNSSATYVGIRTASYASLLGSVVAGAAVVVMQGLRN